MLRGEKASLRAVAREDLPRLLEIRNDLEAEPAGGTGIVARETLSRRVAAGGG